MDIAQRITTPFRNIRQVIQNVSAQLESSGAIEYFTIEELQQARQETKKTLETATNSLTHLDEAIKQAEINIKSREDSNLALGVAEDRTGDIAQILVGLPVLLATDETNLAQFIEYICQAPDYFERALINADSNQFECIRKIVANVQRKK